MENKLTKKEILTGIMNGTLDHDTIVDFCTKEIAALDRKADKAKERAAEKRAAGDDLLNVVANALTEEFATRDEITARVNDPEATVGKVGYRLTSLVKSGVAQKAEAITKDEDGKSKKVTVYALA